MMKPILLAATVLFAASAACARMPAPRTSVAQRGFSLPGGTDNCAITVAFTSYGAGIDGPTRTRMERMLRVDRRVRTFTSRPWGREGELTLCVNARRSADASRIFRDLRNMVPRRPRGPVQVELHPGRATSRQ
jgi:hypothetical protein